MEVTVAAIHDWITEQFSGSSRFGSIPVQEMATVRDQSPMENLCGLLKTRPFTCYGILNRGGSLYYGIQSGKFLFLFTPDKMTLKIVLDLSVSGVVNTSLIR